MKLPKLTKRQWLFFGLTWLVFAISIFALFLFGAIADDSNGGSSGFWIGLGVSFIGPALLVAITSLLIFGARKRIKNGFALFGCGVGVMFFATMCIAIKPAGMLYGARTIAFGSASGSPAEIATTDAAWVDIEPAFIDVSRIGYATHTTTDSEGRSSTRRRAVAPILTAHGEADPAAAAEQVALFVCLSDKDDLRAESMSKGTISGRMFPADMLELQAIDEARVTNRIAHPRCVVPGRGASAFWLAIWILVMLAGATGGAALVTAVASPRKV